MIEANSRAIPATGGALPAYSPPEGINLNVSLPAELQKPRLRRWEASEYLGLAHGLPVATATLAKMASVGGGPKFSKAGRWALYPKDELDRWALEKLGRTVGSTSELKG